MSLLKTFTTLVLGLMTLASMSGRLAAAFSIEPADLRCEFRANPVGMDVPKPRLYWKFKDSEVRGQGQSAYQILLASSEKLLTQDKGDWWDAGKVNSDQTIAIVYAGKTLLSAFAPFSQGQISPL
jgi:alpha-L-rhamnosidase